MDAPIIAKKPALHVVGYEAAFRHALSPETNNFEVIPPLWGRIDSAADTVSNRAGKEMYGIIYGLPEEERAHPHELQYIAAVAVNTTDDIPEGMAARTIPEVLFATFVHRGPICHIGETCRAIYREWLPQSEYEHAEIADVELYDHRFDPEGEDSVMEYSISIRSKGGEA